MNAKTLTLRLAPDLYERAQVLARHRGESLNRLFQVGFEVLDQQEREERLRAGFALIAETDREETDVGFALAAQTEVVVRS